MTVALSKLNFRDLGGLPAGEGARVRNGVLFRSEGPASFFDDHRAELGELGFRSVCDLRSEGERQSAPNDWCGPDCEVLHLDMNTDLRAETEDFWNTLKDGATPEYARSIMVKNYRKMPGALKPHLPAIVDALLAGQVPMMVHCTAGKDRTGVVIALLLSLVGVSRADILDDYRKSDVFGQNMAMAGSVEQGFLKSFGFVPSKEIIAMVVGIELEFLEGALAEVDETWGSVAGYFEACGIGAEQQAAIRAALVEARG